MPRSTVFCVLLCLALSAPSWAGTTGKIMGVVMEARTGNPLPFANILIKGTALGAAADEKGEYFIINVPVGEYALVATMMGYNDVEVKGAWVSADLTTHIDIQMTERVLEAAGTIEVVAVRPMIEKGVTASTKIVDGQAIESMPVSSFSEVLAAQAGVVESGQGRSGGLHIRGGRSGEVTYVVDGVNTTDPVTMGRGIIIDNNAIAEMSVLSGGFNAEFGEAMSGVVNIVTKEGGESYSGGLEYYTDDFLGEDYDYGTNDVNMNLGGPVPGLNNLFREATFFVSGSLKDTDNRAPGVIPKPYNDRQQESVAGKLRITPRSGMKLVFSGNWAHSRYHAYSHARSRGNWLREGPRYDQGNTQLGMTLTHSISPRTFYTINLAGFNTYTKRQAQDGKHYTDWQIIGSAMDWVKTAVDSVYYDDIGWVWYDVENQQWYGTTADDQWRRYYQDLGWCTVDEDGDIVWTNLVYEREALNRRWYDTGSWEINADSTAVVYVPFDADAYLDEVAHSPNHKSGLYKGDIDQWYARDRDEFRHFYYDFVPWWHHRNTTHYTADVALTHQLGKFNQLKAGAFRRWSTLELTDLQFLNQNPYSDHYEMEPDNMAAYLQNKIEYEDLTVNMGLRWDYFNPKATHFAQMESLDVGKIDADPKDQFSPRLGIAFAVTDKSVLYASYGHFFQPVELGELYQGLNADITSGVPLLGNPDLPPEKTVAYEIGIKHAFNPDLAGEVTAYYKDVENLLATRKIISTLNQNPVNYTIFLIEDFAVVKGMDISLTKRAASYLSGSLTYSYLDAKGSGSSAREYYYLFRDTETPLPKREYPLEFDVTHSLKANLNLYMPQDFGPPIAGFHPLGDLNANIMASISTGPPYTPTDSRGNPGEVGSRRLPGMQTANLRIDKYLSVGRLGMGLFVDVRNLFDQRNVVDVYPVTGKPDDNGNIPLRESYADEETWQQAVENWKRYVDDPANYDQPRTITVGATMRF
ncbi:TonB-dependent receptor [Candidatus Fermentibacteria bacterium]|nr:TonB-dependent receptor [Candidatus Fermentibacteria bacterium]